MKAMKGVNGGEKTENESFKGNDRNRNKKKSLRKTILTKPIRWLMVFQMKITITFSSNFTYLGLKSDPVNEIREKALESSHLLFNSTTT